MRVSDQVVQKLQALIEQQNLKQGDRLPAERQPVSYTHLTLPTIYSV